MRVDGLHVRLCAPGPLRSIPQAPVARLAQSLSRRGRDEADPGRAVSYALAVDSAMPSRYLPYSVFAIFVASSSSWARPIQPFL